MPDEPDVPFDAALETAREILDNTICECGDMDGDHVSGEDDDIRECCVAGCECQEFRSVRFSVERAK